MFKAKIEEQEIAKMKRLQEEETVQENQAEGEENQLQPRHWELEFVSTRTMTREKLTKLSMLIVLRKKNFKVTRKWPSSLRP